MVLPPRLPGGPRSGNSLPEDLATAPLGLWTHSVLSPLLRPRLLQTERSFAARFWATRYQWRIPALVTASTFPSRCCRVPGMHEGPGEPLSGAPAALAPGSWTRRAPGVAAAAAAAPRGRPALNGRSASSPNPGPARAPRDSPSQPGPRCRLVPESHPSSPGPQRLAPPQTI